MSSIYSGPGFLVTYIETNVRCPICEQIFDAGTKIEKAKYPFFDTTCLVCKGKISISVPIMGGTLKCYERGPGKHIKFTETKNRVNGKVMKERKPYDDNSDEPSELPV